MRAPRSIRFKLITLYVALLTGVFICFGAYTYWGFQQFLVRSLQQTLLRRAEQIATTILDELPSKGEAYVANEIQARYAPELNERAIRITDAGQREIYASKNARLLGTSTPPPGPENVGLETPSFRKESSSPDQGFELVRLRHRLSNRAIYTIEVGAPDTDVRNALEDLVLTLVIGFPVLIGIAILGGYSLLGRVLRPVDEIVGAAEQITFKNINQRLPVPETGDEFERISEALNRMIERLDETFQITNRFSADASHELRTPLTIIQGELEIFIKDRSLPAEAVERAGNILEEVARLSHIVEGLLLVSRLEGGEAQMNMTTVDFGQMVVSVAEEMEPLAKDKLLTVVYRIGDQIMVEGDALRLQQVAVNLIDNAIKYTPEGGTIALEVRSEMQRAVLEVTDTGMGISSAALPQVFHRFFRAEEAKAGRMQGSGLGLAIVQSIVEAHGGKVFVQSNENRGARFQVELPLLVQEARAKREGVSLAL